MTLYDLMENMSIQGNIRLAVYDESGDEIDHRDIDFCDGLSNWHVNQLSDMHHDRIGRIECCDLKWCEVLCMFCGKDGYLQIALEVKEDD